MASLQWRARIDNARGGTLGAGLLVADSLVLTCRHVVQGQREIRVTFPGIVADRAATAILEGPWKRTGDSGDVALLKLAAPVNIRPCEFASLDALAPREGVTPLPLRAQGFPRGHERDGLHVTLRTDSRRLLRQEWLQVDVDGAHLALLNEGFSGAAVYDPHTEQVAGIVTDAVLRDDNGGTIGRMLPLSSIRRYWEGLDDLLLLAWLEPRPRRELRALVDGLTTAKPLEHVFREAFPGFLHPPGDLRSPWDAIRYVAEMVPGPDRLRRFLVTLTSSLEAEAAGPLSDWIRHRLPSAGAPAMATATPATSVIVRLERETKPSRRTGQARYELSMSTLIEGVHGPRNAPVSVRAEQVRPRVEAGLPDLLHAVLGREWMLEFVVPQRLMDQGFEDWHIVESAEEEVRPRPLHSIPLVIRHVDRLKPLLVADLTRRRWQTLRERGTLRPEPVECRPGYTYDEFHALLDADDESCALLYGTGPDTDQLAAALHTGIPIMLWRRSECTAEDHTDCPGQRFRDRLAALLADTHPDELPVQVMKLRKKAKAPPRDEEHCGHLLTLFWDDPARSPDPRLSMEDD